MTPIPTTPEQWDALKPSAADRSLTDAASKLPGHYYWMGRLAAASRIAEHERCVERLATFLRAERMMKRELRGSEFVVTETPKEFADRCMAEARRILEDRT